MIGYANTNWGSDLHQRKSTSGYAFSLNDCEVSWKTKHIQIRYHFFREMIMQNEVVLKHIPTNEMVVDPFTKPIARDAFVRHVRSLGLCRM